MYREKKKCYEFRAKCIRLGSDPDMFEEEKNGSSVLVQSGNGYILTVLCLTLCMDASLDKDH